MVFRDNHRTCPRCGSGFAEMRTSLGHSFERCTACRGNWVNKMTLHEMLDRMKPGHPMAAMDARWDNTPMLRCPTCTQPMLKRQFGELALDECTVHGVWFDGDELEQTLHQHALAN